VNGNRKTREFGAEKLRLKGGYARIIETLSKRMPFVLARPLVALIP